MTSGSFINNMMQDSLHPVPEVGMGATQLMWTDRSAGTIIEVSKSGKKLVFQRDAVSRKDTNGMSDSQSYLYKRNSHGLTYEYSLRKNGRWVRVGDNFNGPSLLLGHREEYYDYSF